MDRHGAAPRPSYIQEMANILSEHGITSIQPLGKNWAYKFIQCHDEIKTTFSRQYNYQHAKCEDPKVIKKWFDLVQIVTGCACSHKRYVSQAERVSEELFTRTARACI